jgi:hypothetical protein
MTIIQQFNQLSINQIEAYLQSKGWEKYRIYKKIVSIWHNPNQPTNELVFPIDKTVHDYELIAKQFINKLADIEEKDNENVVNYISNILINNVKVRLASDDVGDGSIPYEKGLALIQNAKDMLTSAALSAYKKRNFYVGSYPDIVTDYVNSIRLGQTERGSYIVNLLAPITYIQENSNTLFEDIPYDHLVYYSLKKSLVQLVDDAKQNYETNSINTPEKYSEFGISANLCDSIIKMAELKENSCIDVSLIPSSYIDQKKESTNIRIVPEYIPHISIVSEIMKKEIFYENHTIYGSVGKLQREMNKEDGEIALACKIDGKERIVSIHLNAKQYLDAIIAHREKLVVKARGNLDIKMNHAKMEPIDEFIIIDSEHLEFEDN